MERPDKVGEKKQGGIQNHESPPEDVITTRLSGEKAFIFIFDEPGSRKRYFGGSQLWLLKSNGVHGGCGTVAAANILAYLAINRGEEWKHLYPFPDTRRDHFIQHMESVYRVVKPLPLPNWNHWVPGDIFKKTPPSLGIPGLSFFSKRLVRYGTRKGVMLVPVWRDRKKRPHLNTSLQMSLHQAVEYIRQGLGSGCPVAMINTWNPALQAVRHWIDELTGETTVNDFQRHWVVITALLENQKTGEVFIEVSSWGYRVDLNLSSLWGKGYSGLIYFR
ncbi:MAG: hypothetical protein SCK57_03000 [Bacillota bacterium]|nr:hypothetical protein [Bacillota bacterium]MDW7676608.1 hypothetical protein [Bacillota bacterium]